MSGNKYKYRRLTGEQLWEHLDFLGWTPGTLASVYDTTMERVRDWLHDRQDIPHAVHAICSLAALPGGREVATQLFKAMREDYSDAQKRRLAKLAARRNNEQMR